MFKQVAANVLFMLIFFLNQLAIAQTGPLFQFTQNNGAPGEISFTLCLNVNGKKPLSCQNYLSESSTISLIPTIQNHAYHYAGIKVNTPGFTLDNLGLTNSSLQNGYGVFQLSSTSPYATSIDNEINFLAMNDATTPANPVIAMTINPTNMINQVSPTIVSNTISVADLETVFDTQFCQLNTTHNVTLNSTPCQTLINYISHQSGTGNFNLNNHPITNNGLGITGVTFQKITYNTTVKFPPATPTQSFAVSGGLLLPNLTDASKIKGVVVYFQGTQLDKSGVGSNINYSGTQLVAATFASQGYIVVIPDYVGMGDDYHNVHPYVLYPTVSAQTAIDMLNIVKSNITIKYPSITNPKLFSVGYSEGGAYSLWFNTYSQSSAPIHTLDTFYTLTHSVGLEGAYSTSVVTSDFLFNNVDLSNGNDYNIQTQSLTNLVKPILAADALISFATYSSFNGDYTAVFNPNFYNMICRLGIDPSKCNPGTSPNNLLGAFTQQSTSPATQVLYSSLGKYEAPDLSPLTLAALAVSLKNTAIPLVSSAQFRDNPILTNTLAAANVDLSHLTSGAVSIVSLNQDSVVSPNNFNYLNQNYPSKLLNATSLDQTQIQVVSPFSYLRAQCKTNPGCPPVYIPVDHPQAQIYEYLYALNIFNSF